MSEWKNRIIAHGEVDPQTLIANPKNWRKHPTSQRVAMEHMLDHVGWVQDVIVNQRTGGDTSRTMARNKTQTQDTPRSTRVARAKSGGGGGKAGKKGGGRGGRGKKPKSGKKRGGRRK